PGNETAKIRSGADTKGVSRLMQRRAIIARTAEIYPAAVTALRRRHAGIVIRGQVFAECPVAIVLCHRAVHRIDNLRANVSGPVFVPHCQLISQSASLRGLYLCSQIKKLLQGSGCSGDSQSKRSICIESPISNYRPLWQWSGQAG